MPAGHGLFCAPNHGWQSRLLLTVINTLSLNRPPRPSCSKYRRFGKTVVRLSTGWNWIIFAERPRSARFARNATAYTVCGTLATVAIYHPRHDLALSVQTTRTFSSPLRSLTANKRFGFRIIAVEWIAKIRDTF